MCVKGQSVFTSCRSISMFQIPIIQSSEPVSNCLQPAAYANPKTFSLK